MKKAIFSFLILSFYLGVFIPEEILFYPTGYRRVKTEDVESVYQRDMVVPKQIASQIKMDALDKSIVVVGIPFHKSAGTIGHVVEVVKEGLRKYYPDAVGVIIISGGPFIERGLKAIEVVNEIQMPENVERIAFLTSIEGGKGWHMRGIMDLADVLEAEAVAFFDADLQSITPEWVKLLLDPILEEGVEFVTPSYARHHFDGTITNNIVHPLVVAIYGKEIRQPIGGEFAASGRLVDIYLGDSSVWQTDVGTYGVDNWLTTTAIVSGMNIGQANLGVKIHEPSVGKLEQMFRQVTGIVFDQIGKNEDWWRGGREIESVPILGTPKEQIPETVELSAEELIGKYKEGFERYQEVYRNVLSQETFQGLEALTEADYESFNLPAETWATIVYDFLVAYHFNKSFAHDELLSALVPIYQGRTASFVKQTEDMTSEEAERLIQAQVQEFIKSRPYFMARWEEDRPE